MNLSHRVLLVEGSDDFHVVSSLLQKKKFPHCFEIQPKDGIESVLEVLPIQLKASGIERVGILVDADVSVEGRWHSIKSILETAGYTGIAENPPTGGLVVKAPEKPTVGVWIMPDNTVPGMLEDFMAFLVPKECTMYKYAEEIVDSVPKSDDRYKDIHRSKALIHTWLAWKEDPGTPLGLAITKKYFSSDAEEVEPFVAWLKDLFVT